jgi:hypothetical protein
MTANSLRPPAFTRIHAIKDDARDCLDNINAKVEN